MRTKSRDETTIEQKQQFCQTKVTLNGMPAKVCGTRNEFASVVGKSGERYEWSWHAVRHVIENRGGVFTS